MLYETLKPNGDVLIDYINKSDIMQDVNYASLTAPAPVRCEICIDGEVHDVVYVNESSHSWWTQAGGKFLPPQGLRPGQRLRVVVNAPAALRVDWI